MRKKFLENRLARLQEKRNKINGLVNASTDVNEVRSLTADLEELDAEIAEVREEISLIDAEERANAPEQTVPANAELVNPEVRGSFRAPEARTTDIRESMEYRTAFMNYVQRGTAIPAEMRSGDAIDTTDTGAAIPLTVMREIINTVRKSYGNLYNKVRKLSVQGGVEFPVGELEAEFKWIGETTVSPDQEIGKLGKVSFGYHTAEIRIAQTFLSSIVTMPEFEAEITRIIAEAYLEAMDYGIVNGTGDGQMLGILNDSRVTNVVSMTAAQFSDWKQWRKLFFSKLPLKYRAGEFIFPLSTVDAYLETMSDDNNNPIFAQAAGLVVNDGDAVNPNGRFFGREIALVEPNIIADFDSAASGDVVGIFWQPNEYAINENFGFNVRRYFDEDRNKWINKALVVVDGKVLNPEGFVLIKKA